MKPPHACPEAEQNLATNANNCGECRVSCKNNPDLSGTCTAGVCKCVKAGYVLKDGKCQTNVALHQPAAQSTTFYPEECAPGKAVDGNTSPHYYPGGMRQTGSDVENPWW